MMNILDTIASHSKERVAMDKKKLPFSELVDITRNILHDRKPHLFKEALRKDKGLSFICEIKKASPSKGLISEDFPYLSILRDYEAGGSDCISCLTEPKWFLGSEAIFQEIRAATMLPMIRKDFIVDPYQIFQAKLWGADAVLLICSLLEPKQLSEYLEITHSLGMDALVEAHDEGEIRQALNAGATIIGVNNRNLKDFTVDYGLAEKLRELIPPEAVYVAESGMRNAEDVARVRKAEADAILIGEALMRAQDRKAVLKEMKKAGGTHA